TRLIRVRCADCERDKPRSQALPGNALPRGPASRPGLARQSLADTGSQAEPGNESSRASLLLPTFRLHLDLGSLQDLLRLVVLHKRHDAEALQVDGRPVLRELTAVQVTVQLLAQLVQVDAGGLLAGLVLKGQPGGAPRHGADQVMMIAQP